MSKHDFSEQILDYFIEELVTDRLPPDLSAQIEAAWLQEKQSPGWQAPLPATKTPESPLKFSTTASPVALVSRFAARKRDGGASRRRNIAAFLLAVGACGLLAILSWRLEVAPDVAVPDLAQHGSATNNSPPASVDTRKSESPTTQEPTLAEVPYVLDIDDVPFNLRPEHPQPNPNASQSSSTRLDRLAAKEIIAGIDQQLAELWSQLKVRPTDRLSDGELAERISRVLTGQPAASIEARAAPQGVERLVVEGLNSVAFSNIWSENFVQLWFARSSLPQDDENVAALKQQIATHIQENRPWNQIPVILLGGDITPNNDSSSATFIRALAGNGNHRLVERIGTCFLNANWSCVRCHDPLAGDTSETIERQPIYWSTVALLQGIDAQGSTNRGERLAVDQQAQRIGIGKPQLEYYDLLDGRLQVAEALLPDRSQWHSMASASLPRQALANWISQSQLLDEATVNQVWSMVHGRPLVAQVLVDGANQEQLVALQARQQLQQFLAQQFRAHDHDLKQLVRWVVQSNAAALRPMPLGRNQWLAASEEELQRHQLRQMTFAAFSSRQSTTLNTNTLETSLLAITKWRGGSGFDHALESGVALAQPNPVQRPRKALTPSPSKIGEAGLGFDQERPTAQERSFIERLLSSKRLRWEDCVEHVVGLNESNVANGRVKNLADELLRQHSGDTQAALFDLLWAVKNSTAF